MTEQADAQPTKQFFIDNLARDISLEDAILDLADNSIDSLVRVYHVDVSPALLHSEQVELSHPLPEGPLVKIQVDAGGFVISDTCGGLEYEDAKNTVFRFGRPTSRPATALGVYGIGLKRAVFKLGKDIVVESRTTTSGFRVHIDVQKWAESDDWYFPLEKIEPAESIQASGSVVSIRNLNEETLLRIGDRTFLQGLEDTISKTYTLFLERFLSISLNEAPVPSSTLPVGQSDELISVGQTVDLDGVQLYLYAGLAPRDQGSWASEHAGWYVLCNGRVVVSADKTRLTGWGVFNPTFHTKYRGFIGIAFFFSEDPAALPWTTTKRGLNVDSPVYQKARAEMSLVSKPVISFLNNMYPTEASEEVVERELVERLKAMRINDLVFTAESSFKAPDTSALRKQRRTTSVQYRANRADLARIRKHLGRRTMSASAIGRHTFEYFLDMELPE